MGPRLAKLRSTKLHESLDPQPSLSQANPGRIPVNGIPGPRSSYPANKPSKSHGHTREGSDHDKKESSSPGRTVGNKRRPGPQSPPFRQNLQRSVPLLRRLGGYTHRVRSRAPAGKSKNPPRNSTRIAQGLGGYSRGPILGYPKRMS